MILSALSPDELCSVISSGNTNALKTIKGIGLKTAQRIIVDLKDKIANTGATGALAPTPFSNEIQEEAVAALTLLGFNAAASQKATTAILKESPALTVEQVIKEALKRL